MSPTIQRTVFFTLTVAVGLYAIVHLTRSDGLTALLENRNSIRRMEADIRDLEAKLDTQAKYVEDIKAKKPEVVVPLIRKRTGWVREGETDFREPAQAPSPQP
jgi:hypothetical protein